MNKVARVEAALRTERETLRKEGNLTCANVINTYLQNADDDSKTRLFDIIMLGGTPQPLGDLIQPNFEMSVNWDQVANAWIGAFESGYSPWLVKVNPGADPISVTLQNAAKGKGENWYADGDYWASSGQMYVDHDDPNTGDDGDGSMQTLVTKESIVAGLQKMAEKSPSHFANMISGNDDAETHDVFAQYVILGEIIYG